MNAYLSHSHLSRATVGRRTMIWAVWQSLRVLSAAQLLDIVAFAPYFLSILHGPPHYCTV